LGEAAPDFELDTLDGRRVRLSDLEGRTVLVNFWATWCGPCRVEMPTIQARFDRFSPDLVVLAVNFKEPESAVRAYVDELGLTFDVLLDPDGRVNQDLYRVRGYPTTLLIDRDGVVRVQHIGIMTENQLDQYLMEVGVQ
jgi:peroxiredoxin